VRKPCNISDYRENPLITIGSANITGFPPTYPIFLFEEYRVSF
jgi:hypothetical protein